MSQRSNSIKRLGDEHPFQRPSKRSTSPRNSQLYVTPPTTPSKELSRSKSISPRNRLITSFSRVFGKSNSSKSLEVLELESPEPSGFPFTPESIHSENFKFSPTTPLASPLYTRQSRNSFPFEQQSPLEEDFHQRLSNLTLKKNDKNIEPTVHQIFTMPEILFKIISYVDEVTVVPHEEAPVRRRPLSYQHALLIHKDKAKASKIWNEALESATSNNHTPLTSFNSNSNNLFNCFLVNKLWYRISVELASTKLFFMDHSKWSNFVLHQSRTQLKRTNSNTKLFVMHKISKAKQSDIEVVSKSISGQLEWIEMYICPKILPTPLMLSGSMLKKLVLPGSKLVNDSFLRLVAKNCPLLENLDLRECVLVSDSGVISITRHCQNLKFLNLGRHSNSELITDRSLLSIASNNPMISTLGFAGCSITDRGLWELVISCTRTIERLSLNKCLSLTNNSIPSMLKNGYLQNLSVLEIRHNVSLTNLRPLVEFKRNKQLESKTVLIEGCEVLEYRMRKEEYKLDMEKSKRMFKDIANWCNDPNDGDLTHTEIMRKQMCVK